MADEAERTIDADGRESSRSEESGGHSRRERGTDQTAVDDAAESFVSLEQELQGMRGTPDRPIGAISDVERVPATAVPEGYPVRLSTDEALRLRVGSVEDADTAPDPTQSVYVEWPPSDDGPLSRLLALREIDTEQFADLHGEEIPLRVEKGFLVPDLPAESARGSASGVYGIVLSLVLMVPIVVSMQSVPILGVLWAAVSVVLLPVSTYYDAWYLRTHTDWEGGPLFWTTLAFLPVLNVLTTVAYLVVRHSAERL